MTREECLVNNGLCQLPMVLSDLIMSTDTRDPASSGKRHPGQVERHDLMYKHLEDALVQPKSELLYVYPHAQRRDGQTTLIAQFAYAYSVCFPGSSIALWLKNSEDRDLVISEIHAYVKQSPEWLHEKLSLFARGVCVGFAGYVTEINIFVNPVPPCDYDIPRNIDLNIIDEHRSMSVRYPRSYQVDFEEMTSRLQITPKHMLVSAL